MFKVCFQGHFNMFILCLNPAKTWLYGCSSSLAVLGIRQRRFTFGDSRIIFWIKPYMLDVVQYKARHCNNTILLLLKHYECLTWKYFSKCINYIKKIRRYIFRKLILILKMKGDNLTWNGNLIYKIIMASKIIDNIT